MLVVILVYLCNCAAAQTQGLLVRDVPADALKQMASEAAAQVGRLYPPARSQLRLQQSNDDDFGRPFVRALRSAGFGMSDASAPATRDTIAVDYLVDRWHADRSIVVIVKLRTRRPHILARAYLTRAGKAIGAGVWTMQEAP